MTRKHYVAIAETLKTARKEAFNKEDALNRIADRLANLFKDDNARFDRQRFIAACEADNG